MANLFGIHSVGDSLMTYLRNAYPAELRTEHDCTFSVVSSGELENFTAGSPTVTLYLYRVNVDEHQRNRPLQRQNGRQQYAALAVDLHFLLTIWAESPVTEHTVCAWVLQQLHLHPVMDLSSLTTDGGWGPHETVQIIPEELSNEDLMRIWDALSPGYRLSLSYIARSVVIDSDETAEGRPVIATRYGFRDKDPEEPGTGDQA